jgi:molecular chaperone DnaK
LRINKTIFKNNATGKENKITIKSDSGLTDAEIQRMIREAEENAESDKKAAELINARNSAESQIHSLGKDFDTYKDQITEDEKTAYETALTSAREAITGEDVDAINNGMSKLFESAGPIMTKKQAADSAQAEAPVSQPADGQTVDAAFKEV